MIFISEIADASRFLLDDFSVGGAIAYNHEKLAVDFRNSMADFLNGVTSSYIEAE